MRILSKCRVFLVIAAMVSPAVGRAQNWKLPPTYGTVTIKSGANSNGSTVRVEAGGTIKTNLGGVAANIADPPDVRLHYTAGSAALILRAESAADTTLLVNLPDGKWIANDDGPNMGLNPYLRIENPQSGQYDIWVGTFAPGAFPPATLVISEMTKAAAMNMSQFAVVDLENRTSAHPIRYRFRWGQAANWSDPVLLKPGRSMTHSFGVEAGKAAPLPQISFEKGIGVDAGLQNYDLQAYMSKSRSGGKGYHFIVKSAENTRDTLDLIYRSKTQEDAAYKLNTAVLKILGNDPRAGEELATQSIQLDPNCARAFAIRGRSRIWQAKYDGALRDYAQSLRMAPGEPEYFLYRSETFNRKQRYDRAVDEASKALEIDPFLAKALTERAKAHLKLRNYDLAIADARKAVKLDASEWVAQMTLGEAYLGAGQYVTALDALNQTIALQKNDYEPFAARAQTYQALGESDKASLDWQEAIRQRMPSGYAVHYSAEEANRALNGYQFGVLVTPDLLKKFNMQNFEVDPPFAGKGPPEVKGELDELVANEWLRHRAFKFEATAGVDLFLRAARITEEERRANGMDLTWYYGPVTSPVARFRSGDDLGGLRVIGNLKLRDRKELTMIFALTYYPPTGEKVENGKVGMLFDGDNARIQLRLHEAKSLETDFLFQSFGANVQKNRMVMRPGYNLDETTGTMINEALTASSLSTRCMHCHNKGFEPTEKLKEQLAVINSKDTAEIAKLEGIRKFVELAYVNGAGRVELKEIERKLIESGPAAFIPFEELYQANRAYWLEIYPQYVEMRRNPRTYLEPPPPRMNPKMPKLGDHKE